LLDNLPASPSYFFLTRAGLADKVGFLALAFLEVNADFLIIPAFVGDFLEERGRPLLGFSADGFGPFVFPVNFGGIPDFFFDSWGGARAGAGLGTPSDEDNFGILTIFLPAFP